MRILIFSVLAVLFFGCGEGEQKPLQSQIQDEIPPSDVPISKPESNATINTEFPPLPVSE